MLVGRQLKAIVEDHLPKATEPGLFGQRKPKARHLPVRIANCLIRTSIKDLRANSLLSDNFSMESDGGNGRSQDAEYLECGIGALYEAQCAEQKKLVAQIERLIAQASRGTSGGDAARARFPAEQVGEPSEDGKSRYRGVPRPEHEKGCLVTSPHTVHNGSSNVESVPTLLVTDAASESRTCPGARDPKQQSGGCTTKKVDFAGGEPRKEIPEQNGPSPETNGRRSKPPESGGSMLDCCVPVDARRSVVSSEANPDESPRVGGSDSVAQAGTICADVCSHCEVSNGDVRPADQEGRALTAQLAEVLERQARLETLVCDLQGALSRLEHANVFGAP